MADITSRAYVPPQEFSIISAPTTVTLRPGNETNVELRSKSNINIKSEVTLSLPTLNDIQTKITLNETFLSPNEVTPSVLNIKALEGAKAHPYTLPIIANFSIPTLAITQRNETAPGSPARFNIAMISNFTITVLPQFTLEERLDNFYIHWISPLTGIWAFSAAILAVIMPLIIHKNKKKLPGFNF